MKVTRRTAHQRLSQFLWWNVYHVQPFQANSSEVQVSANSCRDSLHFPVNKTVVKGVLLIPQYWSSILTLAWDRMPGEQWMRFQILLFTFICLSYKCNSVSPLVCETTPVCFSRCFTQTTDDWSMKYTKCCNPKIMNNKKKTETKSTFIHKVNTFLEKMVKYALNKVDWLIKRSIAITPFLSVHVWASFFLTKSHKFVTRDISIPRDLTGGWGVKRTGGWGVKRTGGWGFKQSETDVRDVSLKKKYTHL